MMDFDERVIPGVTANFQFRQSLARYEFAKRLFKPNSKVLDIGCGTAYGSDSLAEKCEVVAMDNSKEAIDYARKHYSKKIQFMVEDAHNLPFKKASFDAITSFEVIEHLKKPKKFLKEIRRVLKPNGKAIFSTPNKLVHSPSGKIKSPYHLREYSVKEFGLLLNKYFRNVNIKGQIKSKRAKLALKDFMTSQKAREGFVKSDLFGIRKMFPKTFKEKIWKYLGWLFGRSSQEFLKTNDFPIRQTNLSKADYLIAVCEK